MLRFGLAPYFKSALTYSVKVCYFDESYNAVTKNKQMDISVRYCSEQRVSSRYLQSIFMGHGHAHDTLEHFLIDIGDLELNRVTQVSMDGPNVNWAFHNQLQSKIKLDSAARCLTSVAVGYTLSTAHSSMAVMPPSGMYRLD